MVTRTLEARLTWRLVVLAGAVLVGVGLTAVVVTDRLLAQSDTADARVNAASSLDAIGRELAEGDSPEVAESEVVSNARSAGARLAIVHRDVARAHDWPALTKIPAGQCASVNDEAGAPMRACAAGNAETKVVAAISTSAHENAVRDLARGMLAVIAAALFLLWLAIRRALAAPVAELTALVAWTTRVVDRDAPQEPPSAQTEEIAKLESAFDALVRRLFHALDREKASSAHIAHELRTPITAMIVELDEMKSQDAEVQAAIARIRGDASRLADVIDAILLLSSGDRERGGVIVNLADVARDLAPRGCSVSAPDEALVEGDERLLALALRNLLDNAQKYGGSADMISITRHSDAVEIAVTDHGPGLSDAARSRMFDRYWRGTADGDGGGLGLALVREVAERHGGRAEAKTTKGSGLSVTMTMPLVGWSDTLSSR